MTKAVQLKAARQNIFGTVLTICETSVILRIEQKELMGDARSDNRHLLFVSLVKPEVELWLKEIFMKFLESAEMRMTGKSSVHTGNLPKSIIRIQIPVINRQNRNLKKSQKLIMCSMIQKRKNYMISLEWLLLRMALELETRATSMEDPVDRVGTADLEVLILGRIETEHTENIISKMEIWVIFLEIFLEICFMGKPVDFPERVLAAEDLVFRMDLDAAPDPEEAVTFSQRSVSALRMLFLAVNVCFSFLPENLEKKYRSFRFISLPELRMEKVSA